MSRKLRTLEQLDGAPALLILLPGAYMQPEEFAEAGFFRELARRRQPLDLIVVDLDLATISSGAAGPLVKEQILDPARRRGYETIWLGGISLGGLLALAFHADTPGCVDGLCLLAPYPGSRLTMKAIADAGGLASWQPTTEQLADPEFRVWHWLQRPPAGFPVFVGYGSEDRFAAGMWQIAGCFPPEQACAVPGAHAWPAWQRLWEVFLDRHFLPE